MLKIDLEKGLMVASGDVIQILTEYTMSTRIMMKTLEQNFGKEKMELLIAEAGKIAYEKYDEPSEGLSAIPERFEKVFENENV